MKIEDLKNTKIYLSNEEDRARFQNKVFNLGVEWGNLDKSKLSEVFPNLFTFYPS